MIIATAGHVDHGKTSLVKALTDIDTDRLEEEKRRGMSIDLGFAYADFGLSSPIGFVDVPGHERFVRNMLAGVAAIDCALLVIAADDGPMPQTQEHLAILDLLGVEKIVVALTKIDRVDEARLNQAYFEIRRLIAPTKMNGAAIFPVVATSGQGIPALREHLREFALLHEFHVAPDGEKNRIETSGNFRLAVDRAFSLAGAGLVVSGAVYSGYVEVGDRVLVSPGGIEARIRSIHAQNQPTNFARVGQRCALNLSGIDLKKANIVRGDWVLAESIHAPTQRLDVELKLLASEARALKDGAVLQLHLAATSVSAKVALLSNKTLAAGESALAQIVLDKPIAALRGDRFVVRDQAAQRTIGGGRVIDPFGPVRGRAKAARLSELSAMCLPTASEALFKILEEKSEGLDLGPFEIAWNLNAPERAQLRSTSGLQIVRTQGQALGVTSAHWQEWRGTLLTSMKTHHHANTASLGLSESDLLTHPVLRSKMPIKALKIFGRLTLRSLIDDRLVVREGVVLRLPEHRARLGERDQVLLDRITTVLISAGLRPPIVGDLAKTLELEPTGLLPALQQFSLSGHLAAVAGNRFYLPSTITALVKIAGKLAELNPDRGFEAAAFRDESGIGRNSSIEVLEFFDRQGYTRFVGRRRWMRDDDQIQKD